MYLSKDHPARPQAKPLADLFGAGHSAAEPHSPAEEREAALQLQKGRAAALPAATGARKRPCGDRSDPEHRGCCAEADVIRGRAGDDGAREGSGQGLCPSRGENGCAPWEVARLDRIYAFFARYESKV